MQPPELAELATRAARRPLLPNKAHVIYFFWRNSSPGLAQDSLWLDWRSGEGNGRFCSGKGMIRERA